MRGRLRIRWQDDVLQDLRSIDEIDYTEVAMDRWTEDFGEDWCWKCGYSAEEKGYR